MSKKLSEKQNSERNSGPQKYDSGDYNYDDGIDPRELLPAKGKKEPALRNKKLLHGTHSWTEKVASEGHEGALSQEGLDDELENGDQEMTAIDHDHNSRAKSPMIPVLKKLVATDSLAAPGTTPKKKKPSFRKLVKAVRKGGKSKEV